MMTELPVVTITLYSLLAAAGYLVCSLAAILLAPKFRKAMGLYALLAGVLGLFLGRLIFCLVRMDTLFFDEMGDPLGLSPFFDPAAGSISVVGVMLGAVLAAPLCRLITKQSAASFLDGAALPALCFFAFMRFIEPLSGQGYGVPLEDSPFAFAPLASYSDWTEMWSLNVWFIEGVLALIALIGALLLGRKTKLPGTRALYAALLLAVGQIIPEALRCDDVLYIFIFARVTHIGLAVLLFFTMLLPLLRGRKRGLSAAAFGTELALTVLGLGLCILAIYALDKITAWPAEFVYAGWTLVLVLLTLLIGRRIYKEDHRKC